MFESIEVAITRILRIQKREIKGNLSCVNRFARVPKVFGLKVSGLRINHVPKSLGLID